MMGERTVVITGASDGIGAAAASQLAADGVNVVLVGRSHEKTSTLARQLGVPHHVADFADLRQVRTLADALLDSYPRIDVLANNAGGLFARRGTVDGNDLTFQVNHLAPFLLTNLLRERLITSHACVIQTSSASARTSGHIDLSDLDNERRWTPTKAYGDSKLSNILFTRELHRRYGEQGLHAVAFHPGGIATNFANDTPSRFRFLYHSVARHVLSGSDVGGRRLNWFINGTPGKTWMSGNYYEKHRVYRRLPDQATDAALAGALWDRSEMLTK
jgi:NAD(P)-dependent dehydrogenase (short-subunit alcohol dehydrogenase family)